MTGSFLEKAHGVMSARPDDVVIDLHAPRGGQVRQRELHKRAEAVARWLQSEGIAPGDRVLLRYGPSQWLDFLPVWLGVLRHGAVAVPLSPRFTPADVERVAIDCEPVALLGDDPDLPGVHRYPPAAPAAVAPAADATPAVPVAAPPRQAPETLATVLYTSGTTGTTKGVACPLGSLVSATFPTPTRSLHCFPLDSAAAQNITVRALLGSPTHITVGFAPKPFAALIETERIEWCGVSPAMAGMLLRSGQLARHDVGSLRTLVVAGAPSPPELLYRLRDALPHASIVNHYTLTEAGQMFLAQSFDPARPTAVGRAGTPTAIRVTGRDGACLPAGETGEIQLRPEFPATPRYYLTDPEATARVFGADGWLRTGDLGYLDQDGYLHLVDRAKDLIVRGGTNISCLEVEAELATHPALAEVAVFGVPDATLGEVVGAAVVFDAEADAGTGADAGLVRAYARSRGLGEERVPEVVLVVGALPRTATGKVLKHELVARAATCATGAGS